MKKLFLILSLTAYTHINTQSLCTLIDTFSIQQQALYNTIRSSLDKTPLADECTPFVTPLMKTAESGSSILVQYLLEHGAIKSINKQVPVTKDTALILAAKNCSKNSEAPVIVQMLLQAGADKSLVNLKGKTALAEVKALTTMFKEGLMRLSNASCALVEQLLLKN